MAQATVRAIQQGPGCLKPFGATPTRVRLEGGETPTAIQFDLARVKMTPEQRRIAGKLFSQNPTVVVTTEEHRHDLERGKDGPALEYLTRNEFETIRQIGVRLGTAGDLVATACDFCLHCVKLEALPVDDIRTTAQ
jgi:hypothetical protein